MLCICAILSITAYSGFFEPVELDSVNADLTPSSNTYCSVFSDPRECEQQRESSQHKYWTGSEVRKELWDTMRGLAELETREIEHHNEQNRRKEERKRVFDLFRQTMAAEVRDVHNLQAEMSKKHNGAFRNLSSQLLTAASLLKNYTDSGLSDVNKKVTHLSAKQNSDYSDTLALIRHRVSQIYAHMDELHAQSAQNISDAQEFSEKVEAEMKQQDTAILEKISALSIKAADLKNTEASHFQLLAKQQAEAEAKESLDTRQLNRNISLNFEDSRAEQQARVEKQQLALQSSIHEGLTNLTLRFEELRNHSQAVADSIREDADSLASARESSRRQQEAEISAAREAAHTLAAKVQQALDALDARADDMNATLLSAAEGLERSISESGRYLATRLDANVSALQAGVDGIGDTVREELGALNAALNLSSSDLERFIVVFGEQQHTDSNDLASRIDAEARLLNISLLAAVLLSKVESDDELSKERASGVLALSSLRDYLLSSNRSNSERLQAVIAQQQRDDEARLAEIRDLTEEASSLKAEQDSALQALNTSFSATSDDLGRAKAQLTEGAEKNRKDIEALLAESYASLYKNLTAVIDSDRTFIRERADQGISSLHARISLLTSESAQTYDEIRKSLSKMSAGQDRLDRIFSTNISELSDKIAGTKQVLSSRIDSVDSHVTQERENLQSSMEAVAAHGASEIESLSRNLNSAISGVQLQAHQELSDLSHIATKNQTALSSFLVKNLALIQSKIENRSRIFLMNMASSEKEQSAINAKQLQELQSIQQNAARASHALEFRVNALEQGLRNSNEEMSRDHIDFMSKLNSLRKNLTGAFEIEYEMLENHSTLLLEKQHKKTASTLKDSINALKDQVETASNKYRVLMNYFEKNLSISLSTENSNYQKLASEISAISGRLVSNNRISQANTDHLNRNVSHVIDNVHTSALAIRKIIEAEFGAYQNKINSTFSDVADALKKKRMSDRSEVMNSISEKVLQTNGRIWQLRNSSAKLAQDLANEIADARRTQLAHNKDQSDQISELKFRRLSDKQVVDALLVKLQIDLESTKSQLLAAKQDLQFQESQDATNLKHKMETGLDELRRNTTLLEQNMQASSRAEVHETMVKVLLLCYPLLFILTL